jgi:hypothetical protein
MLYVLVASFFDVKSMIIDVIFFENECSYVYNQSK